MKNTYFTVDMRTAGYNAIQYNTGLLYMYRYSHRNLVFLIVADSNNGITDKVESNRYVMEEFRHIIECVTVGKDAGSIGIKAMEHNMKEAVCHWNSYMFDRSCTDAVMGASVAIVIIIKNRYVVLQAGDAIVMSCISGHGGIKVSDSDSMLGRHSDCNIYISRGRIGYGDIIFICSVKEPDDITKWYINTLLRKRYGYTRKHGRGISCRDINSNIVDTLCSRGFTGLTSAVVCCERSVI